MAYGVGTDLAPLKCIVRPNKKFGMSFTEHIPNSEELLEFPQVGEPINYLAKRPAAKEAFAEAVGMGIRGVVTFHSVGAGHDALGKSEFSYAALLVQRLEEQGIVRVHLSISDEEDAASAFAVAEREAVQK